MITVYAPASMGNVSVGFDLLGAALAPIDGSLLGDTVSIEAAATGISLTVTGPFAHKLPAQVQDNIVYQCAEYFALQRQYTGGLSLVLSKNLPVGSGLGSSASSVVAAFVAINSFFGEPYSRDELLLMMGEFEGKISGSIHYDNVAPSFLGGMQLMLSAPSMLCAGMPVMEEWYWVVAYPGISLSTSMMRELVPTSLPTSIALQFGQQLSGFIHALHTHDSTLALSLLTDVIAEPYRCDAIPQFNEAKHQLLAMGLSACGISGSGPSLFAVTTDKALAVAAKQWLQQHYLVSDSGFAHVCHIDQQGSRQL
ncbi:homoserine kinase [Shewanella sp. NIFS-20-20]|uniref:homoserine kinase n=1 Tax=Shewanella sp. NIFS-20-20 TaxID=2853806 RepID=UPI001C4533E8|nr:homoserine kinase [Shewanella sp. NIFS-20-20]MBV7314203.1 homoserine kinase [Shewanella sp. NIFS-20-20]